MNAFVSASCPLGLECASLRKRCSSLKTINPIPACWTSFTHTHVHTYTHTHANTQTHIHTHSFTASPPTCLWVQTIESEAATALAFRIASTFDSKASEYEQALGRIATAIAKYHICKRAPQFVYEAMECLGGNGRFSSPVCGLLLGGGAEQGRHAFKKGCAGMWPEHTGVVCWHTNTWLTLHLFSN